MTTTEILAPLDAAINAESWDWLQANNPKVADAIQQAVEQHVSPDKIYRHLLSRLHGADRSGIAVRCKQAATHLAEQQS